MGGQNETMLGDLRMHENAGEVHIHDDKNKVKFKMDVAVFKREFAKLKQRVVAGIFTADIKDKDGVLLKMTMNLPSDVVTWGLEAPKAPTTKCLDVLEAFVNKL